MSDERADVQALLGMDRRLREELSRYGLPIPEEGVCGAGGLEILLRHIYSNRELTQALDARTIETLKSRVAEFEGRIERAIAELNALGVRA